MKTFPTDFSFKLLLSIAVFSLFSQAIIAFPVSEKNYQQRETLKESFPVKTVFIEEVSSNLSWLTENENDAFPFYYAGFGTIGFKNFKALTSGNFYLFFQDKKLLLKHNIFPFHFFW